MKNKLSLSLFISMINILGSFMLGSKSFSTIDYRVELIDNCILKKSDLEYRSIENKNAMIYN